MKWQNRPVATAQAGQAEFGNHSGHSAGGVVSWRKLVDIAYCVTARQGPRALEPPLGDSLRKGLVLF